MRQLQSMRVAGQTLKSVVLGLAAITSLAASGVNAQVSSSLTRTEGVMLGVDFTRATLGQYQTSADVGHGFRATVGLGVTKWLMPYATYERTGMFTPIASYDQTGQMVSKGFNYTLQHVDMGARFSFPTKTHRWVPYASAAYTRREIGAASTVINGRKYEERSSKLWGNAFTGGTGIQYFPHRVIAFDLGLQYSSGNFDHERSRGVTTTSPGLLNRNSIRGNVGIKFYPLPKWK